MGPFQLTKWLHYFRFLIHHVILVLIQLSIDGFARNQETVVNHTKYNLPNGNHHIFLMSWRLLKILCCLSLVERLSRMSAVIVEDQLFVSSNKFWTEMDRGYFGKEVRHKFQNTVFFERSFNNWGLNFRGFSPSQSLWGHRWSICWRGVSLQVFCDFLPLMLAEHGKNSVRNFVSQFEVSRSVFFELSLKGSLTNTAFSICWCSWPSGPRSGRA